nr:MAG TPA: apocytochrome F [Caudoviricetes sp.]
METLDTLTVVFGCLAILGFGFAILVWSSNGY